MSKIIVLDPGHGGSDAGAVNGSRREKDDNLRLALAAEQLLTAQGMTVILTRSDDTYPTLGQRAQTANRSGADLFVSLHRNSFTTAGANGTEIWVYTTGGAVDEAAAGAVLEELAGVGIQSNRGIKKGNYQVLRETSMTSMLVELGFISNKADNDLFDKHFSAYAKAITKGICRAVGVTYREDAGEEVPKPLYRVQVGAFSVKSNAEAFLAQVRAMGLEAFLVSEDTAPSQQ